MPISDSIDKRERFSKESSTSLEKAVKAVQGALYSLVVEKILNSLETDGDGIIKFTVSNARTAARFKQVWATHQRQSGKLTQWIVKQLVKLFDLNTAYMREVTNVTDSLEARARKRLLLNLGYDLDAKKILPDSWLDNLAAQSDVKQRVVNKLNTAIQSKMPLKQFRKEFRDDFLGAKGQGWVERYFNARSQDLFSQFDRSTQAVYRDELKLNYAIYSGTIKQPSPKSSGTRDFCWRRVNNLYDLETIEKWNSLDWNGKIEGSDVKLTCGGYGCRHHLSWVSEEMAATLQKRGRELNKLNPPKPVTKQK